VATTASTDGSDDATERFLAFDAAIDLLRRIASVDRWSSILDDVQCRADGLLLLRQLVRTLATLRSSSS